MLFTEWTTGVKRESTIHSTVMLINANVCNRLVSKLEGTLKWDPSMILCNARLLEEASTV